MMDFDDFERKIISYSNDNLFADEEFDDDYLQAGKDIDSKGDKILNSSVISVFINALKKSLGHRKSTKSNIPFYRNAYNHAISKDSQVVNTQSGEAAFVNELIRLSRQVWEDEQPVPLIRLIGEKGLGKTFFLNNISCKYMDVFHQPKNKVFWVRTSLTQIFDGWSFKQRHMHQVAYIFTKHYLVEDPRQKLEGHQYHDSDLFDWIVGKNIKKFDGSGDDINYAQLKSEISYLRRFGKRFYLEKENPKKHDEERVIHPEKNKATAISLELYYCIYHFLVDNGWHPVYVIDGLDPYFATDAYYERFSNWLEEAFFMMSENIFKSLFVFVMRDTTNDWAKLYNEKYRQLLENENFAFVDEHERSTVTSLEYRIEPTRPIGIISKRVAYLNSIQNGGVSNTTTKKYIYCVLKFISIAMNIPYEDVLNELYGILGYNTRQLLNVIYECSVCTYHMLNGHAGDKPSNSTINDVSVFDEQLHEWMSDISGDTNFSKFGFKNEQRSSLRIDHKYNIGETEKAIHLDAKLHSQSYRVFGPLVKGAYVYQNEPVLFTHDESVSLNVRMNRVSASKEANNYGAVANLFCIPAELIMDAGSNTKTEYQNTLIHFSRLILVSFLVKHAAHKTKAKKKKTTMNLHNIQKEMMVYKIPPLITAANCRYLDFYGICQFKFNTIGEVVQFQLSPTEFCEHLYHSLLINPHYLVHVMNSIYLPENFLNDNEYLRSHDSFELIYHFERLNIDQRNERLEILSDHLRNRLVFINYYCRWFERILAQPEYENIKERYPVTQELREKFTTLKINMLEITRKQVGSALKHQPVFLKYLEEAFQDD